MTVHREFFVPFYTDRSERSGHLFIGIGGSSNRILFSTGKKHYAGAFKKEFCSDGYEVRVLTADEFLHLGNTGARAGLAFRLSDGGRPKILLRVTVRGSQSTLDIS